MLMMIMFPHLTLFEDRDLFLQGDVLLLQLSVVLQKPSLTELVLLNVIAQLIPLQLHHLAFLQEQRAKEMSMQ